MRALVPSVVLTMARLVAHRAAVALVMATTAVLSVARMIAAMAALMMRGVTMVGLMMT